MLILAEGTIHAELEHDKLNATHAWLGPMADAGMLQAGYVDNAARRVWMILTANDVEEVHRRLANLPVVASGQVSFQTHHVTAMRFT